MTFVGLIISASLRLSFPFRYFSLVCSFVSLVFFAHSDNKSATTTYWSGSASTTKIKKIMPFDARDGVIEQRGPLVEKDCLSSSSPELLSTLFRLLFSFVVKPGKKRGKVTGWAENT